MVNQRRKQVVLVHGGVRRVALHHSRAELISDVKNKRFQRHAAAQRKPEKVVAAPGPRLRVIEDACAEGNQQVTTNPQVFRPQAHARGVVGLAPQDRFALAGRRAVFHQ